MRSFIIAITALAITTVAGCDTDFTTDAVEQSEMSDATEKVSLAWVNCVAVCRLSVYNEAGYPEKIWGSFDPEIYLEKFEFAGKIAVRLRAGLVFEIEVFGIVTEGKANGVAEIWTDTVDYIFRTWGDDGEVYADRDLSLYARPGVQTFSVIQYHY